MYATLDLAYPDLAWETLMILEAIDWKWTIKEILEQPEDLLNDVLQLKAMANKVRANVYKGK